MKPKNIILVLGDDKATLGSAQGIAKQLPNCEIKRFSPGCLLGLNPADVARITVVGHASSSAYGASYFNPKEFVKVFDQAREIAGFKKEDIKGLRCFGCELGLVDEQGHCYAQKMANEFTLQGYHLNLSAFTNRHTTPLQAMRVGISSDGQARVHGYKTEKEAQRGEKIKERLDAKVEEIKRLQTKVSLLDEIILWGTKTTKAVDKAHREYDVLLKEYKESQVQIDEQRHPIKALDHNKKYQFLPSITTQDLQAKIKDLRERIERCEENIKVFQSFNNFALTSGMQTRKEELEEELRTIENYLAAEENKAPVLDESTLKKEQQSEKSDALSWLKSAWQGVKQFFSGLLMKSSAKEEATLSESSPNPQVAERTNDTHFGSYRKPMLTLDRQPGTKRKGESIEQIKGTDKEESNKTITDTRDKKGSPQSVTSSFKDQLKQLRQEQDEPQNETHSRPML